ncbi:MAG: TIM-barrel domain-containing protein [Rectinema sp.]
MLYVIKNLSAYHLEGSKAIFAGENGQLEVVIHTSNLFSIFYIFDESIIPPKMNKPHAALLSFNNIGNALSWDSVLEKDNQYELLHGSTRILVDKATSRVDIYKNDVLFHGGEIGHKDLVVPQYPLRVQLGDMQSNARQAIYGKFNFRLEEADAFFGLGEKTGKLNKRNRLFKLFNRDALGYNAETSDPLYKSVPFFIKANRVLNNICGFYFPNLQVDEVNFGVESEFYYDVVLSSGPFGYYVITGDHYREVLSTYCKICGLPALPPLFSFGYLTSSMGYTEPDIAQEKILEFFARIEQEDIPCEGMYFSSGYAKAENGERYTFVWNEKKFPHAEEFIRNLRNRGYRICCNVKPGILLAHPWYDRLAKDDVFIPDNDGSPLISYYWGNSASFIDFSRKEGFNWWVIALKKYILEKGISGVWNDNNEFEIEDKALPIQDVKNILPIKMAEASFKALRSFYPGKRPWLISRSGYAGLQRYARTWTGDNVSSYDTFRFNIAMGMNLGLSGLPFYGHDIGGFVGPIPDEELLLRWCQSAVFQPRFVMHSWKPDGSITEPWLYPNRLSDIRNFIRIRYRFLPYIYDLAIRASETGIPMESPVALEFPEDISLQLDRLDRMAGDAILIPAPPEQGKDEVSMQLPNGINWFDPISQIIYKGGETLRFHYGLDEIRYFFRCGTVIPTFYKIEAIGKSLLDGYEFIVIPPAEKSDIDLLPIACIHSEDDGESDFILGSFWRWKMEYTMEEENCYCLNITQTESVDDKHNSSVFRKKWRFLVPDGFMLYDGNEVEMGNSVAFDFDKAPKRLSLRIKGAYRNKQG